MMNWIKWTAGMDRTKMARRILMLMHEEIAKRDIGHLCEEDRQVYADYNARRLMGALFDVYEADAEANDHAHEWTPGIAPDHVCGYGPTLAVDRLAMVFGLGKVPWSFCPCCGVEAPRPGTHKAGCSAGRIGP